MRKVGNDIYIQRGETWSLDFQVENNRGDPYMLLKEWKHPYLAITVTAARYTQKGDFRRTWWLDLNQRWVEDRAGNMTLEPIKKFISTEALYIANFTIADILAVYGTENGGNIVLDKTSDFDVTNYLFFTDSNMDNGRVYKYLADYEVTDAQKITVDGWASNTSTTYGHIYAYFGDGTNADYYVAVKSLSTTENNTPPPNSANFVKLTQRYIKVQDDTHLLFTKRWSAEDTDLIWYEGDAFINTGADGNNRVYICNVPSASNNRVNATGNKVQVTNDMDNGSDLVTVETWKDYDFRIIKAFTTRDWVEQTYLYDIKVLAGESVEERVYAVLVAQGEEVPDLPWTEDVLQEQINLINDKDVREECQAVYDSGMPLMPDFDTKALILMPAQLIVSANIQGGSRINVR